MNRYRILFFVAATLSATFWAYACGDGATEPPAPPPDPPRPTTVTVAPPTALLTALSATVQLTAEVRDQNGQVMAGAGATWTSSNASVATVGGSGLVTAAGNGTATITATAGGVSGTATVTVTQVVSAVVVSPAADTLVAGDTLRLSAEATDANGHPVAGAEFTWASGDMSVAVVDGSGLVTGTGAGEVEITATSSGVTGRGEFTVMAPLPTAIVVTPDTVALTALGETEQLAAEVRDQAGRAMAGVAVSWSSADTTVAAVDSAGLVTAAGSGATTITAAAGQASGEAVVTVMPSAGSVVVTPAAGTVAPGDTLRLVAEAFDENGHGVEGAEFDWSSSDVSAARVDGSGLVTGVAEGTATITAMVGDARGTAEITVGNPDRAALVALYNATDGPNWVDNENWLTDAPLGDWYGVRTDASGRVDRLDLSENNLTGSIPPELANLTELTSLDLADNELSGSFPAELGQLASLTEFNLAVNDLTGEMPPEIGNLTSLTSLNLTSNGLSGPIPSTLGNLAKLSGLYLGLNDLTGPIPPELGSLANLRRFYFHGNEGLCAPGIASFADWLGAMAAFEGPFCNASDTGVLESLFEAAGGPGWPNSDGWLGGPALARWHGIRADSLGRVTALDLSRNGLAGRLPRSLGELAHMAELRIADNSDLSGRLPLSLTGLSLRVLHYAGTDLCAPVDTAYRNWLGTIPSHEGTGAECAPLSDREILEIFYETTGGSNWTHSHRWLTDAPLDRWHGVRTDSDGRVSDLRLWKNQLSGEIPAELGQLAKVSWLSLSGNNLTGPIPPELGGLSRLSLLDLRENNLTGPIPPELGGLSNLQYLYLSENNLTGPIPPELGGLSNLVNLFLSENNLTGPIPPELGGLPRLWQLFLSGNNLTGPIPPELGGWTGLSGLALRRNAGLTGALPQSLTRLLGLRVLLADGTGLCAPLDPAFQTWLDGVYTRRIAQCGAGDSPAAYLTQAVQSREFPVPLVAGEKALLRVFPTAGQATSEGIPLVRARFYVGGQETHVQNIPGKSDPIPTEVDEGGLSRSANAEIAGWVIQPGLEMVIELDPDGMLDPELGVAKRIPETGRLAVDVKAMPLFDLTLIPFLLEAAPDSSVLRITQAMSDDPSNHILLGDTRTLLPVGDMEVSLHDPVVTSSSASESILRETELIRVMEGAGGHYLGTMTGPVADRHGLANVYGRSTFSVVDRGRSEFIIAHELGHNMSLRHPPGCEAGSVDFNFPHSGGTIGAWGYDFRVGQLVSPNTGDLMSYCENDWISDYHFTNAARYRLYDEGRAAAAVSASTRSLLLWGGVGTDSVPYLEPAFVIDAPAAFPDSAGEYRITGRNAAGGELFSHSFTMLVTVDGDGSSGFAFALPVRAGWEGSLATITLSGPEGSVTLDGESDIPMAILRNPRTGQVRGILRDPLQATQAAADGAGVPAPGLEVLFSRGIPGAAAWRR